MPALQPYYFLAAQTLRTLACNEECARTLSMLLGSQGTIACRREDEAAVSARVGTKLTLG